MRKIIVKLLLIMTATICFSIGTACSSSFAEQGTTEPCDNHSFTNYVSNNDATVDADGTKTATCDNEGCFETDTIVDEGSKILAVIINLDNGEERIVITKNPGESIGEISEPTKLGAIFDGWSQPIPSEMPNESVTITAQWKVILIINDDEVVGVTDYGKTLSEIVVPEGIKTIGYDAFYYCEYLEKIVLPTTLEAIEEFGFEFCTNLSQINLPNGLKSIDSRAFSGCWSLTSLKIPKSVDYIGTTIAMGAESIVFYAEHETEPDNWMGYWQQNAGWSGDNTARFAPVVWDSLNNDVATDNNIYLDYNGLVYAISDGEAKVAKQARSLRSANIAEIITYKGVDYPVTEIMTSAFDYCEYLPELFIPTTITKVGNAFRESWNPLLTVYTPYKSAPEGWDNIDANVVWDCENNTIADDGCEYTFDNGIKYRLKDEKATVMSFQQVFLGEVVEIPSIVNYNGKSYTVTEIEYCAFNDCDFIKKIIIPETVSVLGELFFAESDSLEEIVIDVSNNYFKVVDGMVLTKDGKELLTCLPSDKTEIIIPNGVEIIKENSFDSMKNIVKLVLPEGLKVIERGVFEVSKLEEVNLPESLEFIGKYAFHGCEQLTSIVIPGSVDMLINTFGGCSNLETVVIGEGVEVLYSAFTNCTSLKSIIIPESVKSIYDSFNSCSSLEYVKLPASVKDIDLAFDNCYNLQSIEIEEGSIFNKGTYNFKQIEIMLKLSETDFEGFEEGDELISTVRGGVEYIGTAKNPYLCVVKVDESLTEFNIHEDCKLIYELPYNESSIVNFEMSLDKALEIVCVRVGNRNVKVQGEIVTEIVTGSAKTVANRMFSYNENLQKIVISSSLTSISDYAFAGCENLTTIEYEENSSLKYIGYKAFEGCTGLTGFEIASSVEMIADEAIPELPISAYYNDNGLYYLGNSENPYIYLAKVKSSTTAINNNCKFFGPDLMYWSNEEHYMCAMPDSFYNLPKNLISIDSNAFNNIFTIMPYDKVTIKDGLCYIGNADNPYMCLIGFERDFVIGNFKKLEVINVAYGCTIIYGGFISDVTVEVNIPETVRVICEEAFYGLDYLDMVVIPKSVVKIGDSSFTRQTAVIYGKYLD